MSDFHPLKRKVQFVESGFPSLASLFPEWNCQSCHKKIAPADQMKNSPLSPPHVSICWTFSISDTHSPLLPHFCHAQIPIAIKTVFVTEFDHGIPYLRTTAVVWSLQSSAAESTLTAKVKRCKCFVHMLLLEKRTANTNFPSTYINMFLFILKTNQ